MSIFSSLFIPPDESDVYAIRKWRYIVSSKLWILLVFSAWSLSIFTSIGFNGFARAGDVRAQYTALQAQVVELREEQRLSSVETLENRLFELRLRHCASTGQLKTTLGAQMQHHETFYRELTGTDYRRLPCDELR